MSQAQQSLGGIAIVGMAGRFPGARNISDFWKCLLAGEESLPTPVAGSRRVDEFAPSVFDAPSGDAHALSSSQKIATPLAAARETPYDGFAAATILDSKNAQKTL